MRERKMKLIFLAVNIVIVKQPTSDALLGPYSVRLLYSSTILHATKMFLNALYKYM